jgi:hypothetical protein
MQLEIFRDAEALAKFSNLDRNDVDYFKHNYPEFIDRNFWDIIRGRANVKDDAPQLWRQVQEQLRQAWQAGFPLETAIGLISVKIWDRDADTYDSKPSPFQKAVMFLTVEPWRARLCICGKRFVADKPSRRFCSTKCSAEARKLSRRVWWSEHGKNWRSDQEQKRAPKGKAAKRKR